MRWLLVAALPALWAQTPDNLLLVVNGASADSREVAEHYRSKRPVPQRNVCAIATAAVEEIDWAVYEREIERPIGDCLRKNGLQEKVLYIVTTMGVPLKVKGAGTGTAAEYASVDSELTLLYSKLKGEKHPR